jgi:hypothetical protein
MPSSLGRRPQATVFSVEDLVSRVRRGEVRVPKFQRRLRWRAKDIKLLFDSVYRGYPIGSLLFWKREAPPDSVKLGPITIDAPASRDAWWVVDGQQRITSLVGVLLHPDPVHGRDEYALGIDLETEEFIRSRPSPPKSWMPLSVVLDTTALLRWLDAYALRATHPEHVATAHRVAKALRDYQLPAYVIEENYESLVRDVFGRLNSAGRKLKPDEVFDALAGSEESGGASTLQAISDSVAELGFGRLERAWILKSLQAVAGRDGDAALARDKQTLAATERALRDVVVFLRRDAGIPHALVLPYSLPIPILAKFFHRHPSPKPRSRTLLSRWLWRGAITGDHQGDNLSEVRQMLAALKPPEEDAVQALLIRISTVRMKDTVGGLAPFAWRTARTRLEANALLGLGPRDLETGQPLDIPAVLETHGFAAFRQILPTRPLLKWLTKRDVQATPAGTLANRLFSPHGEVKVSASDEVLESHALPREQAQEFFNHPSSGTFTSFIEARSALLTRVVNAFLLSKARWLETDRPSIESLIISDTEGPDA